MPSMTPDAATLLQATTDYMELELLPTLSGYHRFQTRVSINVLRTVMRELQLGAGADAAENARLATLLGHPGDSAALNRELAEAIDQGRIETGRPDLVRHLQQTLSDTLAINNPRWIQTDPDRRSPQS